MPVAGTKVRKPPPHIGQLPEGTWAIYNMQNTPLWEATFPTRAMAAAALLEWKVKQCLEMRTNDAAR